MASPARASAIPAHCAPLGPAPLRTAAAMDTPGGKMEWAEGGAFTMKAEGSKPLKTGDHRSAGKMTGGLKGAMLGAGGVRVEIEVTLDNESHTEDGGTMPEVPAVK